MRVFEIIDISHYYISDHARRRWRKRKLYQVQTRGRKRINSPEEAILSPMKIIKHYQDRGTYKVTNGLFDFVIDPEKGGVVTIYKHLNETSRKEYIYKKRGYHETIS